MAIDHIGAKIKSTVKSKGISISEFARRINTSRENVYTIFKRKSIDTHLLLMIGNALEHDFFVYYTPIGEENERLRKEINTLKAILALTAFKA